MVKQLRQFEGKSAWLAVGLAACTAVHGAGFSLAAVGEGVRAARVIADPSSGRRWVLTNDPAHPGGPGRLVDEAAGAGANADCAANAMPIVRAGDRVLVEVNTRAAHGLLEAVALSPVRQGARFRVRLRIGGRVVWAIAAGPGRAVLAGAGEVGQ